jgi:hypothetical protein
MKTKIKAKKTRNRRRNGKPFFSSLGSGGFFKVQPKLTTGKPGDKYETEADNIANKVVSRTQNMNHSIGDSGTVFAMRQKDQTVQEKPLAETVTPFVQRQAEEEEIQSKRMGDIQKQEEEELESVQAQVEEEEEPVQAQVEEEEEPVQAQVEEEEEPIQEQVEEEEEPIQAQVEEEEEPVQAQAEEEEEVVQQQVEEEEEPVQMQEEEEEEMVQPKVIQNTGDQSNLNGQSVATPTAENRIKSAGVNGNKMDDNTRAEMESGFGADFSRVKIHTDSESVQLNK